MFYDVGRLKQKKHVFLINFNHMTILLKRGVLVALSVIGVTTSFVLTLQFESALQIYISMYQQVINKWNVYNQILLYKYNW